MKKLVVITGASSGFGQEIAKIFNADGFPILLLGRRLEKLTALAETFDHAMVAEVECPSD